MLPLAYLETLRRADNCSEVGLRSRDTPLPLALWKHVHVSVVITTPKVLTMPKRNPVLVSSLMAGETPKTLQHPSPPKMGSVSQEDNVSLPRD